MWIYLIARQTGCFCSRTGAILINLSLSTLHLSTAEISSSRVLFFSFFKLGRKVELDMNLHIIKWEGKFSWLSLVWLPVSRSFLPSPPFVAICRGRGMGKGKGEGGKSFSFSPPPHTPQNGLILSLRHPSIALHSTALFFFCFIFRQLGEGNPAYLEWIRDSVPEKWTNKWPRKMKRSTMSPDTGQET